MSNEDKLEEIKEVRKKWEEKVLIPSAKRFRMEDRVTEFHSPDETPDFDFLRDVGFPGQYPFTSAPYAVNLVPNIKRGAKPGGLRRAGGYSGYGTPEDTRDYYLEMNKDNRRKYKLLKKSLEANATTSAVISIQPKDFEKGTKKKKVGLLRRVLRRLVASTEYTDEEKKPIT